MTATAVFVGASGANSGTTTPGTLNLTIPGAAAVGDKALCFMSWNNASPAATDPTGWVLLGAQTITTVLTTTVWTKTITAGEPGSSLSVPIAGSGRCAGGMIVWRAADLTLTPSTAQTDPNSATQTIPSLTPNGDAFIFSIVGYNTQTGVTGFTPPSSWTERTDQITTHASGNLIGASIFTRDAAVNSGNASGATTSGVTGALARSNAWTFAAKNELLSGIPGWSMGTILMGR